MTTGRGTEPSSWRRAALVAAAGAAALATWAVVAGSADRPVDPVATATACHGELATLPDATGEDGAPRRAEVERRTLVSCSTVDEWVATGLETGTGSDEAELLGYLRDLCARPGAGGTPVCRDLAGTTP